MFETFAKQHVWSSDVFDDFYLDPVTIFSRLWYHVLAGESFQEMDVLRVTL